LPSSTVLSMRLNIPMVAGLGGIVLGASLNALM